MAKRVRAKDENEVEAEKKEEYAFQLSSFQGDAEEVTSTSIKELRVSVAIKMRSFLPCIVLLFDYNEVRDGEMDLHKLGMGATRPIPLIWVKQNDVEFAREGYLTFMEALELHDSHGDDGAVHSEFYPSCGPKHTGRE